jgi:hypothetical protein
VYIQAETDMNDLPAHFPPILGVLIAVTLLFALIVLLRAIAQDARRRGKSPLLVILLILCSFPLPLGLIAWLLFRPEPVEPGRSPFRLEDRRVQ